MIIIMSCDDNPYYFDFWEPVSYVWKEKMGHTPVLAHFGEKNHHKIWNCCFHGNKFRSPCSYSMSIVKTLDT